MSNQNKCKNEEKSNAHREMIKKNTTNNNKNKRDL